MVKLTNFESFVLCNVCFGNTAPSWPSQENAGGFEAPTPEPKSRPKTKKSQPKEKKSQASPKAQAKKKSGKTSTAKAKAKAKSKVKAAQETDELKKNLKNIGINAWKDPTRHRLYSSVYRYLTARGKSKEDAAKMAREECDRRGLHANAKTAESQGAWSFLSII